MITITKKQTITVAAIFLTTLLLQFGINNFTRQPVVQKVVIPTLSDREFECLAKNVYFEAGNQSVAGQLAVALVTLNRVSDPRFPKSICGVVSQKSDKRTCQFSWYCIRKTHIPNIQSKTWELSKQAALDAYRMFHKGFDITNGATHFHATYVKPGWATTLEKVARIDDHVFYKWSKNYDD